jgi:two-component system cell cycle response regulator
MLRRLRDNPETKRLPVIMLTANAAPETIATVARLGVRDYITKPFDDEMLISKVAKVVSLVPKATA